MCIIVDIVEFISWEPQPGIVKCRFRDVWGKEHIIIEKSAVVSAEILTPDSLYPRKGEVPCSPIKEWVDSGGKEIITVSTEKPSAVETVDGLTEFDLLKSQIEV